METPGSPPPLYQHGMAYDSAREVVVLHGGLGAGGVLSDTWEYYEQNCHLVTTQVTAPGGAGHPLAYDSARGVTVLLDNSEDEYPLAQTWEYDGSDWLLVPPDPEFEWTIPSGMRMAYDAGLGQAVLFGGRDPRASEYYPGTVGYDGAWASLAPDHHPIGRAGHAMAYDSRREKVVLFGGERWYGTYYLTDTWECGVFTQPVRADFTADPITGSARLAVSFTNDSSGGVDSLVWDYGDGITGTTSALTHTHVYTWPGVYTVSLRVAGLGGSDALTRSHYITVTYPITTRVITYTYDPLYRLTGADYSTGESFVYAYDAVGNRTVHTRTLTATTVITYAYECEASLKRSKRDAANRLDYFYEDGVLTDLDWDANGNLRTQGTSVYTWDAANRLVSANVDGVASSFEYDGSGNRTAQTVDGVTTEYVLDVGGGPPEVIVATTGGASTQYVQVQVQGQILAEQEAGAWGYVLPDHLGSVRTETDALALCHLRKLGETPSTIIPLGSPMGYYLEM
jgi:YD repeat-containing protein